MISDKQLQANQENAKKSTGPRTEAGKERSSLNALRHGLTGQVVVLPQEDIEAYNNFTAPIRASLKMEDAPDDANELQLANIYADKLWKINRISALEDTMLSLGIMEQVAENLNIEHAQIHNAATAAKTFRNESTAFDRLGIYGQRLINSANKVLKQLKDCQAERRARIDHQLTEAARIYKFLEMQEKPFEPKENGFDFSIPQIQQHINLVTIKKHAVIAEKLDFNRTRYRKQVA